MKQEAFKQKPIPEIDQVTGPKDPADLPEALPAYLPNADAWHTPYQDDIATEPDDVQAVEDERYGDYSAYGNPKHKK